MKASGISTRVINKWTMTKEISFPKYSIFVRNKVDMEKQLVSLEFILNSRCEYQIAGNAVFLFVYICVWGTNGRNVTLILNIHITLQVASVYISMISGPLGGAT